MEWPYARVVEDLCGVWDGVQKKVIQGHWWLKATARLSKTIRLPLLSLVFSHRSRSFVSMNRTVIDFVTRVADLLNGFGIWLFDRGFDSRILIEAPLWVIYTSGTSDPLILLTNEPITSEEEARRMIRMYASRWGVEESFRDFNEEFDFQHIMVRTLRRINLLAELALWAYSFATTFFEKGKRILKELIRLGGRLGIEKKAEETFGRILKGLQYLFTHAAQAP